MFRKLWRWLKRLMATETWRPATKTLETWTAADAPPSEDDPPPDPGVPVVVAPANTAPPSISGSAVVDQVLICSPGTWSGEPTAYAYRWFRNGEQIAGAVSNAYTVRSADQEASLACVVTASNTAGSAQATSQGVIVAPLAPVNLTLPQISGTVAVGQTLTASTGTWANSPDTYAHAWFLNGASTGVVGTSYTIPSSAHGASIFVRVTATNEAASIAVDSVSVSTAALPPTPPYVPKLDFSDARNSQYLVLMWL